MARKRAAGPALSTVKLGGVTPIPRIGFGAMHLPRRKSGAGIDTDRAAAMAVARRAVELGAGHIDTAAFYFSGATRANGQLRLAVEQNLRELAVDTLDLVYLRVGRLAKKSTDSIGDRFTALAMLRDKGLIRHLGVSNVTSAQLAEALSIAPVAAVQNRFGVLDQEDAALVDECAQAGIAFMPFFALGGGRAPLAGDRLMHVARRHNATPFQVAIAWGLKRSPTIVQIPGTSSLAHLTENMAASGLTLDVADMTRLS